MLFGNLFGREKTPIGSKTPSGSSSPRPSILKGPKLNVEKRFSIIGETSSQGSMSRVFKAIDNQTGRTVCLKLQDMTKNAQAAARAVKEGRPTEGEMAAKVVHPHVVRTYEYGLTTGREYYILMEYIDGQSLTFMRESRPFRLAERLEWLAQAAEGLAAIHAAGLIHHDFGPRNALIDRNDQLKIIDFGLAVPNTPAFHRPGNRTGTLIYMAPELVRRESTDERIDVFSFGAVAFEFLSNRLPYDAPAANSLAQAQARINQDPLDLAKVKPDLPAELCDLIRETLARRKEDRRIKMESLPSRLREIAARRG